MRLRAVIFDMDGVLIDSETASHDILQAAGPRLGAPLSDELLERLTGLNETECIALLRREAPGLDAPRLLREHRAEIVAAAKAGRIPLKPGVADLLDVLDEHRVPRAVASSSSRETVETQLNAHGLLPRFDCLVCGDMIRQSKPAPDIFLLAGRLLGAAPADCLVLEDSPNGLKAGRAAGMRTCMVPDRIPLTPALAPFADDVRGSLFDVIPLIRPWLS